MTDRYAARSKKEDGQPLPTRQRMAEGHRIRRKPSTDQKKARRQLARTASDDLDFDGISFDLDSSDPMPLAPFEPQLPSSYSMFTTDGNFAVQEAVASVLRDNGDWFREWEMAPGAMDGAIDYVCTIAEGPDRMEVWDTAVREAIYVTLRGERSRNLGLASKRAMEGDSDGQAMGGDSEVLEEESMSEDAIIAARAALTPGRTAAAKFGSSITCPECGNSGTIKEEDFRGSASNPICTSCGAQFMADGSDPWAKTATKCACAKNADGTSTNILCPKHADHDPCQTMADVTGKRRKGSIKNGTCTHCGWSSTSKTATPNRGRTASWIGAARDVLDHGIWDDGGKEKLIHFGAKGYKSNYSAKARKSFRSRHKCNTAKDKLTARYWACKALWSVNSPKITKK